jgi:hypothetical protein
VEAEYGEWLSKYFQRTQNLGTSYKKRWFNQAKEKHKEKAEVCKILKGEVVKSWKRLEIFTKLPHIEWGLNTKKKKRSAVPAFIHL